MASGVPVEEGSLVGCVELHADDDVPGGVVSDGQTGLLVSIAPLLVDKSLVVAEFTTPESDSAVGIIVGPAGSVGETPVKS